MTAVTLTPNGATASVTVAVTGAPAGNVTLTRVDANGPAPVRRPAGLVPIAGAMTITDYEPSLLGTVRYDVVDSANVTTSSSTTLGLAGTGPRVTNVQLPSLAATPDYVSGYNANRDSGTVVHWVEGRADPVVILRPMRTRQGQLSLHAEDYAHAQAMLAVLAAGQLLQLRQADHPGLDMYFAVRSSSLEPLQLLTTGWMWTVRTEYTEVKSPTVPLLGAAGWTFAAATAAYPTFSAMRSTYARFADLTVGPL